jgi:hypothetical protein
MGTLGSAAALWAIMAGAGRLSIPGKSGVPGGDHTHGMTLTVPRGYTVLPMLVHGDAVVRAACRQRRG